LNFLINYIFTKIVTVAKLQINIGRTGATEIQNAVKHVMYLSPGLSDNSMTAGAEALVRYAWGDVQDDESIRAGLLFPVKRILRMIEEFQHPKLVKKSASVYLAAVLEYLTNQLLEKAGNEAGNYGNVEITKDDVQQGIQKDDELKNLLIAFG
jgi:histone H3/H4